MLPIAAEQYGSSSPPPLNQYVLLVQGAGAAKGTRPAPGATRGADRVRSLAGDSTGRRLRAASERPKRYANR